MNGTAEYIGRAGVIEVDGFTIQVVVLDARNAFGRVDVKVKAIGAKGEKWINFDKIKFNVSGK